MGALFNYGLALHFGREFGATIRSPTASSAYAVAYAGDEFVVVLPHFDGSRAKQKTVEILNLINNSVYLRNHGAEVRVRSSFGVASFPDHAQDLNGLLAAADQALFAVKQNGKNSVGLYGEL